MTESKLGKAANLVSIGLIGLACGIGCRADRSEPAFRIESPDPAERIRSIRAAAEAGDAASIPQLVDRLDDEDESVRFFAIAALARLTGQRFDYRAFDPPTARRASVARWREYVVQLGLERASLTEQRSEE